MTRTFPWCAVAIVAVAAMACEPPAREAGVPSRAGGAAPADSAVVPDSDPEGLARSRTGLIFDPSAARPGDTIGSLVLDRITVRRVTDDSIAVGTAEFSGSLALQGTTIRHHDHPEVQATCFEADSASAARLPRWQGDRRRAWFCFENAALAARVLAAPGEVRAARIVIDRLVIHRGFSDEVNAARLLRVEPR